MDHDLHEVIRFKRPGQPNCSIDAIPEQAVRRQILRSLSTRRAGLFVSRDAAPKSPECLAKTAVEGRNDARGEADPPAA